MQRRLRTEVVFGVTQQNFICRWAQLRVETFLDWRFLSGARVKFAHLEQENTVYDWQGSQIHFYWL